VLYEAKNCFFFSFFLFSLSFIREKKKKKKEKKEDAHQKITFGVSKQ
jgi:hypothetical protein